MSNSWQNSNCWLNYPFDPFHLTQKLGLSILSQHFLECEQKDVGHQINWQKVCPMYCLVFDLLHDHLCLNSDSSHQGGSRFSIVERVRVQPPAQNSEAKTKSNYGRVSLPWCVLTGKHSFECRYRKNFVLFTFACFVHISVIIAVCNIALFIFACFSGLPITAETFVHLLCMVLSMNSDARSHE